MPIHLETKEPNSRWGAFELCWYSFCALLIGIVYHRFSSNTWFGEYPWSGTAIVIYLVSIAVALDGQDLLSKVLRFLAPTVPLYLFLNQAQFSMELLQERLGFPHSVLILVAAALASSFTKEKPAEAGKPTAGSGARTIPTASQARHEPQGDPFDRIIGQEHVVAPLKEIADVVRGGIRVGKKNAPHAVLLFLGPTGVGKTEAARALTEAVYGSADAMIRFDMGQFTDAHQASRFYGPPPGYVGSDKGGQLTQSVLKKPRSLVLLDEVEKAHPQIWDAFLPVFDEGYVVDGSFNKKVDMSNTVIVLTSNLLADRPGLAGMPSYEIKEAVQETGAFRPELLGRINEILVFRPLDHDTISEILKQRMDAALWNLSEQGISITVDQAELNALADKIREAKFGVRQIDDVVRSYLRRAIAARRESEEYFD